MSSRHCTAEPAFRVDGRAEAAAGFDEPVAGWLSGKLRKSR